MSFIIGFDSIDIFRAHAAFKGNIGFDLSMIADFDIDDVRITPQFIFLCFRHPSPHHNVMHQTV